MRAASLVSERALIAARAREREMYLRESFTIETALALHSLKSRKKTGCAIGAGFNGWRKKSYLPGLNPILGLVGSGGVSSSGRIF